MATPSVSAYRVLASESRVEILHLLQERGGPVPVDEVAARVGLHVNTAREHLDRLVAARFVTRSAEVRRTRGRPRVMYTAVERPAAATRDARFREQLMKVLLTGYGEAVPSVAAAAQQAGETLAAELTHDGRAHDPAPAAPSGDDEAEQVWQQMAAVETHLDDLGFRAELEPGDQPTQVAVHLCHCPFLELARERTEVVCSVHLGLVRGVLAHQGGPLTAQRLQPFVGPDHCVLHLGT